jgi:hypothetical protein
MNKKKMTTIISLAVVVSFSVILSGCGLPSNSNDFSQKEEIEKLKSEVVELKQQRSEQSSTTQTSGSGEVKKEDTQNKKDAEAEQKTKERDELRKKCLAKVQTLYNQKAKEINNISTADSSGNLSSQAILDGIESETKLKNDLMKSLLESAKEARNECYKEYPVE